MRKHLYVATIAASALVLVAPAAQARVTTAHATTAHATHVLTIGKLRGKPVAPGAKLVANVAKGTSASFSLSGQRIVCQLFRFVKKLTLNPLRPGTATLSNTSLRIGKCKTSVAGAKVDKITVQGLPFNVSASDARGNPVTVSGQNPSSPIGLTATVSLGNNSITCSYSAQSISGHFSNKTHLVTFSKQPLTKSGGATLCPAGPVLFSAHLGPIRDVSVSGSPIVFVN